MTPDFGRASYDPPSMTSTPYLCPKCNPLPDAAVECLVDYGHDGPAEEPATLPVRPRCGTVATMLTDLTFTAVPLDRADLTRRDDGWFATCLAERSTRVVPVWRDQSAFAPAPPQRAWWADGPTGAAIMAAASTVVLLGLGGHGGDGDETGAVPAWVAADLSDLTDADVAALLGTAETDDLRMRAALLPRFDSGLLAYARGLLYWHRRHRYCGVCGSPTNAGDAGHIRRCTNTACRAEHFPRTDPAVIMLITCPDPNSDPARERCLLGRQARWPKGMVSTLAGFVEPGESLEDAVRREVWEETGVRVGEVSYRGSQPWPFPSSIMLGFRGEVASKAGADLKINQSELEEAAWYNRLEVRSLRTRGLKMPNRFSIARMLVEEWLAEAREEN